MSNTQTTGKRRKTSMEEEDLYRWNIPPAILRLCLDAPMDISLKSVHEFLQNHGPAATYRAIINQIASDTLYFYGKDHPQCLK